MGRTKSHGQKHEYDKFYTKPEIALSLIEEININEYDLIIEPSAGSGSFSKQIPDCIAYDLKPEDKTIIQLDWFSYTAERNSKEKVLVIGNPPFGRQNNLAIRFINHASQFADTIAFVLPLSFMKDSIQKKINKNFHLTKNIVLPKNSFTLHDEDKHIPCVFQIWEYDESTLREDPVQPPQIVFDFVKKTENPDFYIHRIGGRAGKAGVDWQTRSISSNYFIKMNNDTNIVIEDLVNIINTAHYPTKDFSVGPRSLSKNEIVQTLVNMKPELIKK